MTAYRRRFLLDKYPQLAEYDEIELEIVDDEHEGPDEAISVLDELDRAGVEGKAGSDD